MAALALQDTLGWGCIFEGLYIPQWTYHQQQHYESLASRYNGCRSAQLLVLKLFLTAWDLWEHHNGILHNDILPEEETAWHLLDHTIQEEEFLGIQALPQKQWHQFVWTKSELLLKSV
jgi:hypothetical protein